MSLTTQWRCKAACIGQDVELFFPVGTSGPALDQIEQAKALCRRCDVIAECLQWALTNNQNVGVWGGMSEDERCSMRRSQQRRRAASS